MALSSNSNIQNALDQWNDNLLWEGNPTKAGLALEAGRYILVNRPAVHTHLGTTINFSSIESTVAKIEKYYSTIKTGNKATFVRARAKQ